MKQEHAPLGQSGFFVADLHTREVLSLGEGSRSLLPGLKRGEPCYQALGETGPCPDCPMDCLEEDGAAAAARPRCGMNAAAFRLQGEPPRALVVFGTFTLDERKQWMENGRYQTILRQNHIIAFEYDPESGEKFISPFISEILAGRYDDRLLIQVMLEDGVLHPGDRERLAQFRRESLKRLKKDSILVRLKTVGGDYRWYRISVSAYHDQRIGRRIQMGTISDADEEVRLREVILRKAEFDELTGIYHRSAFYRKTELLLKGCGTAPYAVVVFDIDRFKMINALFNTAEGDRILRHLGSAIARRMGENETYGRLRDDVFGLCVARAQEEVPELLMALEAAMQEYPIPFHITLTAGICRVEAGEATPVNVLCDRAMLALKSVKASAVEKYALYTPEMGEAVEKEQEMTAAIHHAMEAGEFEAWLQPKVEIKTGALIGAEALVRWNHPVRGLIPPGEFIPLFERNGLITLLDRYVWEAVCRTLRRWMDAGLEPPVLSVNVSRLHLYHPQFAETLLALTRRYGIPPRLLELELTESAYVENPNLSGIMQRLRSFGFPFAMDDFGSGYSSLNMLRSIPVDLLKIDLQFLRCAWEDAPGKIILKSVVGMARELRIPVIAEGVETEEQAEFLSEIGCTMAQGYLYARPMPIPAFERRYFSGI